MLRPSPNHGTQRLPNDDDDDVLCLANKYRHVMKYLRLLFASHLGKFIHLWLTMFRRTAAHRPPPNILTVHLPRFEIACVSDRREEYIKMIDDSWGRCVND